MRTLVAITILSACGDGTPATLDASPPLDAAIDACLTTGGASCFRLPVAPLELEMGTIQLACTPSAPTQSTTAIGLSGHTVDFTTAATLTGSTVDVFYTSDLATAAANATSDATGAYSMVMPAPVPSMIYARARHANEYDMLPYAVSIDVTSASIGADFQLLSHDANAAIEATLGISDPPGSAYNVIFSNDCTGAGLVNAIGTLSSTSSVGNVEPSFVPGTTVFYLDSAVTPQPRSTATATSGGGFSMYGGTPGQTYYVQTWGFLDAAGVAQGMAGLRLVSEVAIRAVAQTVILANIRANQSPQ